MNNCHKCNNHASECKCEGWVYKGNDNLNLWKDILKKFPPLKIEVIPDDPKDQEIANQINILLRHNIATF